MKDSIKYTLASLFVLILGAVFAAALVIGGREPEKNEREDVRRAVEVLEASPSTVKISVPSQGEVKPVTNTQLTAEIGGQVLKVSDSLRAGLEVKANDVLMVIDPTNYQAAHAQSKAALADAKLALANERVLAEQAKRDWERLGGDGEPGELVLRKPQMESAEAKLASAEAAVSKAAADLKRTEIRAPYDGVVVERQVDLGAYVAPGTPLAKLYRSGIFEVRLPLSTREAQFVSDPSSSEVGVVLSATLGRQTAEWQADVVRSERVIDPRTRSVYLVAEISGDALHSDAGGELMPNQFVQAQIDGRSFDKVMRIPRRSVYGANRVLLVDEKDQLRFREVEVLWETRDEVFVSKGLNAGDRVCLTSFSDVVEGTVVDVSAVKSANGDSVDVPVEEADKSEQ